MLDVTDRHREQARSHIWFVVFLLFEALAGTGLAQGKQPSTQPREFQFHTSSSAGVGL